MGSIEIFVTQESDVNGIAVCLKPKIPFVMTPTLIHDIHNFQHSLAEKYDKNPWEQIYYIVWYLHFGRITMKGFDFKFIHRNLLNHKEKLIEIYIEEVFDVMYLNYIGLGLPTVNCSIVNRSLDGCAREFFLMNQINFFKDEIISKSAKDKLPVITPILLKKDIKKHYFPDEVYLPNQFYRFSHLNLCDMQEIISDYEHKQKKEEKSQKSKQIFNKMKTQTLEKIYYLAEKKPLVIQRLAALQSLEYARNTAEI